MATRFNTRQELVKKSTAFTFRLYLALTAGGDATGLAFSDVTVKVVKNDGTVVTKTMSAPDWNELGVDAPGVYELTLAAGELDQLGNLTVHVTAASVDLNLEQFEVTDYNHGDVNVWLRLAARWNWRETGLTYDPANPQRKTGSTVKIYPTATDVDNDTNALETQTFAAGHDSDGKPNDFKFKE